MKLPQSPNAYIGLASTVGLAGMTCVVAGLSTSNRTLASIGIWLLGPVLVGGVLLALIVIPLLARANRRKPPPTRDSPP